MPDKQLESTVRAQDHDDQNFVSKETCETLVELLLPQYISIGRVFFVRHGISVADKEEEDKDTKKPQGPKEPLHKEGRTQISDAGNILKILGLTSENTIIFYSDDTTRVNESVDIISEKLFLTLKGEGLKHENVKNDKRMRSSKKIEGPNETYFYKEHEPRIKEDSGVMLDVVDLMQYIRENMGIYGEKKVNIVLVGHKSNKSGIVQAVENKNTGIQTDVDIKNGEILEYDIDQNYEYMDIAKRKNILNITNKNYVEILGLLNKFDGLKRYIKQFDDGLLTIWQLQNYVNEYFFKYKQMCPKLLEYNNIELISFALRRLFENEKYEFIKDNTEKILKNNSDHKMLLFDIFYEYGVKNDSLREYFEIFLMNLYKNDTLDDDKKLYIRNKACDLISLIYYYEANFKLVNKTKKRSLDHRIKSGDDSWVMFKFDNENYNNNILSLLEDGNNIKVIEANAGTGKSLLMCHINEKLKDSNFKIGVESIFPIYLSFTGKSVKNIICEIQKIKSNYNKFIESNSQKVVYFLDALDEENNSLSEEKATLEYKDFMKWLIAEDCRVVITTRKGHIQNLIEENVEVLQLTEFDNNQVQKYKEESFNGNIEKIKKFDGFVGKSGSWSIEHNPLTLSIICELINKSQIDLKQIENVYDLYESTIDYRLHEWNENIPKRETNVNFFTTNKKEQLESKKDFLSILAYENLVNGKRIDKTLIIDKVSWKMNNLGEDIENLNLIYGEKGVYEFIHKTFSEYFAVKYIIKLMETGQPFFKKLIFNKHINEEHFYGYNLFTEEKYVEILSYFFSKNKNKTIRDKFIRYMRKHQDYISNKKIFIYLLAKFDKPKYKEYLDYIVLYDNELLRYLLDNWSILGVNKLLLQAHKLYILLGKKGDRVYLAAIIMLSSQVQGWQCFEGLNNKQKFEFVYILIEKFGDIGIDNIQRVYNNLTGREKVAFIDLILDKCEENGNNILQILYKNTKQEEGKVYILKKYRDKFDKNEREKEVKYLYENYYNENVIFDLLPCFFQISDDEGVEKSLNFFNNCEYNTNKLKVVVLLLKKRGADGLNLLPIGKESNYKQLNGYTDNILRTKNVLIFEYK